MFFLGNIFVFLLIPVVLLFTLGLPILIGVCVYRDASKRVDCSPLLWALVAALVPSFIGLVIYLIIRRDYPLMGDEGSSTAYYQENYERAAKSAGLPTWAKALIIIGVVIVALCIVALVVSAVFGYIHGGESYSTGHDFYNGF